jgi:hypothetical protein
MRGIDEPFRQKRLPANRLHKETRASLRQLASLRRDKRNP